MVSARFRDIPPIVGSFVTVAFFATPVFWHPQTLGSERWVVDFNPLFAALDVIRAPLLGVAPSPYSWPVLLTTTVLGSAFRFCFSRAGARASRIGPTEMAYLNLKHVCVDFPVYYGGSPSLSARCSCRDAEATQPRAGQVQQDQRACAE
jgi:hypothetical protein